MEKVFVCASMQLAKNQNINSQAQKLGTILAQNDVKYVQGGYNGGLMGLTLNAFLQKSKNVEFYIPKAYYDYDAPTLEKLVGKEYFKAYKVNGEAERLKRIVKCDKVVVLPGGTGTIEELLYSNETARAKEHTAQIYLINIDGYFDGFLNQVKLSIDQGFSTPEAIKFTVLNSVDELSFDNIDNKTNSLNKS